MHYKDALQLLIGRVEELHDEEQINDVTHGILLNMIQYLDNQLRGR